MTRALFLGLLYTAIMTLVPLWVLAISSTFLLGCLVFFLHLPAGQLRRIVEWLEHPMFGSR